MKKIIYLVICLILAIPSYFLTAILVRLSGKELSHWIVYPAAVLSFIIVTFGTCMSVFLFLHAIRCWEKRKEKRKSEK